MRKAVFFLWILVCAYVAAGQDVTQGSLYAMNAGGRHLGACPLKNTAVNVEISGFVARVRVVQDFTNTFPEPIEAVYTFPLSQNGAVDYMTMTVGTLICDLLTLSTRCRHVGGSTSFSSILHRCGLPKKEV